MGDLKMEQGGSVKISGSGSASGGTYDEISISGSGKITSNTVCNYVKISGSGKMEGKLEAKECKVSGQATFTDDVDCDSFVVSGSSKIKGSLSSEYIKASGSFTIEDDAKVDRAEISGDMKVQKDLQAERIESSGSLRVDGTLQSEKIESRGILKIGGDCNVESFFSRGIVTVDGLLNAGDFVFQIEGKSRIKTIGAEKVTVESKPTFNIIKKLVSKLIGYEDLLTVNEIEADEIFLENTVCDVVRGNNIVIGKGSEIKLVEYTGVLQVLEEGKVYEERKI